MWIWQIPPPKSGEYIVVCKGAKRAMILNYEDNKWIDDYGTKYEVVGWLPVPTVPEYLNNPYGFTNM